MKKEFNKLLLISVSTILLTLIFCGCAGTEVDDDRLGVVFESEIVELSEYNLEFNKNNKKEINQAIVTGRILNILDKQMDVKIISKFYDIDDNYLGEKDFTIVGLRSRGEPGYSTTFTITYDKENTKHVDHVKLSAIEVK